MNKYKLVIGLLATTINQKYRDQIVACQKTWLPEAEKLDVPVSIFGGHHVDPDVPIINLPHTAEDYCSAFNKQFLGLKYLYDHYDADFYFFAGTDNYVFVTRILELLDNYNSQELLYIGGHGQNRYIDNKDIYFHTGAGGFILSRSLLALLDQNGYLNINSYIVWKQVVDRNRANNIDYPACDVAIAYFIHDMNIKTIKFYELFTGCDCYGYRSSTEGRCCLQPHDWSKLYVCHYMEPHLMSYFHNLNQSMIRTMDSNYTFITYMDQVNNFILNLNIQLIIYCPPAIFEDIINKRSSDNTLIYTIDYKPTKYFLLEEAVHNIKFPAEFYGWLDSNISVSCGQDESAIYNMIKLKRERISFCYIGLNQNYIGLITGHKNNLNNLKNITNDEDFINYWKDNFNIFEVYYGQNYSILANYEYIRIVPIHILKNIISFNRHNCRYNISYDAGRKLLQAVKCGTTDLTLSDKFLLVSDLYISAFYLNQNDKCLESLQYMNDIAEIDESIFNQTLEHNITNVNYFWPRIKNKKYIVINYNGPIEKLDIAKSENKVIIYANVSLSYKSLCHRDVIILPQNLKHSLPLNEEEIITIININ